MILMQRCMIFFYFLFCLVFVLVGFLWFPWRTSFSAFFFIWFCITGTSWLQDPHAESGRTTSQTAWHQRCNQSERKSELHCVRKSMFCTSISPNRQPPTSSSTKALWHYVGGIRCYTGVHFPQLSKWNTPAVARLPVSFMCDSNFTQPGPEVPEVGH